MIEVLAAGPLATVQDAGRPGYAHLGVAPSGAADRAAARLANRLVGNRQDAAVIEVVLGGLAVRLHRAGTLACTGAEAAPSWNTPVTLRAGAVVRMARPATGLRSYLAVRGGLAVEATLGSRSSDTLGGLGPAPLRDGDLLPIGTDVADEVSGAHGVPSPVPCRLRVIAGPRADWFAPGTLALLTATAWTVRPDSDRVGIRLDGPELPRRRAGELPSEPTLPGALQVPPDGRPILLGPDGPTTGGYPVIAVVADADLDAAFQWRPGQTVRFSRDRRAGSPT